MGSLLHHLCDENGNTYIYNSFRNCSSLLAPDGKICIFESTCSNFVAHLEDALWKYYNYFIVHLFKFTHVRMLSNVEICSALNAAGLTCEKITFQQPKYIAQMYWKVPKFLVPLKISAIFAEKIAP
jgi:cyclopropane fatty-acyl-phospholipid synthase-like methyltransferase